MILSDWLIALFHVTEFWLRTQLSSIQSEKTEKTEKTGINREKPGRNRKRAIITGFLNFVVRVKNPSIGPDHLAFSRFRVVLTSPCHGIKIQLESESRTI